MNLFNILSPDGSPIRVESLPNRRGGGPIHYEYVRNEEELTAFLAKYDHPGRALYRSVANLRDEAERRNKENVESTHFVWTEIDYKDHPDVEPEEIRRRIEASPKRPTILILSGHSLHLYWQLKETTDAAPGPAQTRLEDALKLAADYVGGDSQVAEAARLMRLPGSHNTRKEGERLLVTIAEHNGRTYELDELTDFWLEAQPILPKPALKPKTNGKAREGDEGGEYSGSIDVESRLEQMTFEGPGNSKIHITQRDVTRKLTEEGCPVEETVERVMAVTRKAALGDPDHAKWDWREEEHDVRKLCLDWINKKMAEDGWDLSHCLADELYDKWAAIRNKGGLPQVSCNKYGYFVLDKNQWNERNRQTRAENAAKKANGGAADVDSTPEADNVNGEKRAKNDGEKAWEKRKQAILLKPYVRIDPKDLPPRQYLYGHHYQRGVVSCTAAPGGSGKTQKKLTEAIAMATCRNLLGEQPEARCKVWYHNGEDNLHEINRRIIAICQFFKIPQEELEGWLFVTSGTELPLKVAHGYKEIDFNKKLIEQITQTIVENTLDVFVIDPLITIHGVPEGDNGKMDQVVRILTRIAALCDCSVDFAHHTRKLGAGMVFDLTADDMRGASAIKDAVRFLELINIMSAAEAAQLGIDEFERLFYFRADQGKANTVPPAKKARWFKFESVELANGDNVGVVRVWEPEQNREATHKAGELFLRILDRLWREERYVNEKPGPSFAPAVFAREPEAKHAKVRKATFDEAMRELFAAGTIRVEGYGKPSQPRRRIVRVSLSIAPEAGEP
jgi:hypothetical protein